MSKSALSWVSSSFGDESSKERTRNGHRGNKRRTSKAPSGHTSWVDKYAPTNKDELAVHKRKVEQVEEWIQRATSTLCGHKKQCPMLLLTGPCGSGKSATVSALAAQLNLAIHQWRNNTQYISYKTRTDQEVIYEDQQMSVLRSFLVRSSRYSSLLDEPSSGRLILVQELPNVCFRDPQSFHSMLRQYTNVGHSPTIFVISDGSRGESSPFKLFPKAVIQQLAITEISFKPVTALNVNKVFQKILATERTSLPGGVRFMSKTELDSLSESCKGDLRAAINALQFAATPSTPPTRGVKRSKLWEAKDAKHSFGKDTSLVLFHALGKVLYCKRDASRSEPSLPKHLSQFQRIPLIENPETIVGRTGTTTSSFNLFLHQNYLDFFEDVDHVAEACECLSSADGLHPRFDDQSGEKEYGSSVGVRGLMFHLGNNSSNNRRKWMPIRKPVWYDTHRTCQRNFVSSQQQFIENGLSLGRELYVTLIPFLKLLSLSSLPSGQKCLVEALTRFSKGNDARFLGSEILEEEDEDSVIVPSFVVRSDDELTFAQNEESVQIEEFSE